MTHEVSIFSPLLQIEFGLRVSWKLCLNLWSQRWFKPNLNLVTNWIPFERTYKYFKMLPLKLVKLSELRMFKSSLFHSITTEEKKKLNNHVLLWNEVASHHLLQYRLFSLTGSWKLYRWSKFCDTIFSSEEIQDLIHNKDSL